MSEAAPYEPDRVAGVPHPRHTLRLFGQDAAAQRFRAAHDADRLHHAWMITGPRGVGKATLAWHIARFLLADPAARGPATGLTGPLAIPRGHGVGDRVAALSDPGLFLMRPTRHPDTGTERREITVDVARSLRSFLHLSATDGGRRVVIVDAADQMTNQAANAILKLLEEPPARTTFLLVCHAPSRLLPTIRSRCRMLRCGPLDGPDLGRATDQAGLQSQIEPASLAQLANGSAGEAARLLQQDGPALYADLVSLVSELPAMDRPRLLALTAGTAGPAGWARLDMIAGLVALLLSRLARQGAGCPPEAEAARGEAAALARLAPDAPAGRLWAELQLSLSARIAHGRAVNLDPSALLLDTGLKINETGRAILRG